MLEKFKQFVNDKFVPATRKTVSITNPSSKTVIIAVLRIHLSVLNSFFIIISEIKIYEYAFP